MWPGTGYVFAYAQNIPYIFVGCCEHQVFSIYSLQSQYVAVVVVSPLVSLMVDLVTIL